MNADGGDQLQLTSQGHNLYPAGSSDNRQITFVSNREGTWHTYVMNPDSADQRRLIAGSDVTAEQLSPAGRLSYASDRDGNWEIYVDGQRITHNDTDDRIYLWSPVGDRIAFHAQKDDGRSQVLFVVNWDGSSLR